MLSVNPKIPRGHYIKIKYIGPKPADDFETRPEFEIELNNTSLEHAKNWLNKAHAILDSEFGKEKDKV